MVGGALEWPGRWMCYFCSIPDGRVRHDDVNKWKHFPRYWPFVRGIRRSPLNSPHKGQWRGALMFSLICVWIHDCVNNREAGDLRRNRTHYYVTIMVQSPVSQLLATVALPCDSGFESHIRRANCVSVVGIYIYVSLCQRISSPKNVCVYVCCMYACNIIPDR